MLPAFWYSPLVGYLWGVTLHSAIAGLAFFVWAQRLRPPPGRARRTMLAAALLLPLVTAALPGRQGADFRADTAWLDSYRLLALPLGGPVRLWWLVVALAAIAAAATIWQEVAPGLALSLRRRPTGGDRDLVAFARSLPGWHHCHLERLDDSHLTVATTGRPGRPRVLVSTGALTGFPADELAAVLRHEHAHWAAGRWWWTHALFGARLLQLANPVGLWLFREWIVELEILCDTEAVRGGDHRPLASALVRVYEATDPEDRAARDLLRRRVDVLLGRRRDGAEPPVPALVAAILLLAVSLPWIV